MSAPDRRFRCVCGHLTGQHGLYGVRACRQVGCDCAVLQKVPQPCCLNCGHPVSFRTLPLDDGRTGCAALACTCVDWVPRQQVQRREDAAATAQVTLEVGDLKMESSPSRGGEAQHLKFSATGPCHVAIISPWFELRIGPNGLCAPR